LNFFKQIDVGNLTRAPYYGVVLNNWPYVSNKGLAQKMNISAKETTIKDAYALQSPGHTRFDMGLIRQAGVNFNTQITDGA
jgi:hypothetical protein